MGQEVTLVGRILCWLGLHRPPPHIDPEESVSWYCDRCGDTFPGAWAYRRKKNRK